MTKTELISECCGVKVEYSKNYSIGAVIGYDFYRCPKCGEDPCGVGKNKENKND